MSGFAYPYLRLSSAETGPWQISAADGVPVLLGDVLPAWDYSIDLSLRRSVIVDLRSAAEELGFESVRLGLQVVLGVGGGKGERARRLAWSGEILNGGAAEEIAFQVTGAELSQAMSLSTEIVLLEGRGGGPLSAARAHARLWEDMHRVVLEPDARRFPIEATSFAAMMKHQPAGALWHLDWTVADLDRDFVGAVRLYLNSDRPEFVGRVGAGDGPVMQLLMSGVAVQLVRGALESDALDLSMAVSAPETLGGVVAGWIQQAFPNQSLRTVRALAQSNPAFFESSLGSIAAGGDVEHD